MSSSFNSSVSRHLLYTSFFFSLHMSGVQNFLGPQAEACFGATPVPNVGKSSALLMSGALKQQNIMSLFQFQRRKEE